METIKNNNSLKLASLLFVTGCWPVIGQAAIMINEIDYDQPGSDTAEFIEIFNSGTSAALLDNITIDLINGNNLATYRTIDLSGYSIEAGGYFVVCGNAALVANCNYSFTNTSSWFQNGAPDAIALLENGNIIDSLSYEGMLAPYTEGDPLDLADSNVDIFSLSRLPDGFDSNNNQLDFQQGCLTPGSANIAGTGDCSMPNINPVPIPAAAWLFVSGILGLAGFARRK